MKFIKNVFNDIVGKIKKVYQIAPVTIISMLVLTIITVICFDNFNKVTDYVVVFLIFLTIGSFLTESLNKQKIIGYSLSSVIALIFTILFNKEGGPGFWTGMYAICYGSVASILGVYFRYKASNKDLQNYVTGAFVSICKLSVIYGDISIGVLIIYLLVNYLLLEDLDTIDFLERIELFILGAYYGPSIIYSIFIPDNETEGFFKILIKYVLNILVLIYFVVIYLYIIKIIFSGDLPSNEIFSIISFLFAVGLPVWTMAQSYNQKKLVFLDKTNNIMPYLFAPFIGLQTYAMMLRVFSYGLTTSRYLGLMLIVVEVAYIVLYSLKKADKTFLVLVAIVVVSTIIPFINANSLSNYSQSLVIKDYDMNANYSSEEMSRFKSAYSYLLHSEDGVAYINKYLTAEEKAKIEKSTYYYDDYKDLVYLHASRSSYGLTIDVDGYSKMYEMNINGYDSRGTSIDKYFKEIQFNNESYNIYPLVERYIDHKDNLNRYFSDNYEYIVDENTKIILKSFDLDYNSTNNTISSVYIEGYVLKK